VGGGGEVLLQMIRGNAQWGNLNLVLTWFRIFLKKVSISSSRTPELSNKASTQRSEAISRIATSPIPDNEKKKKKLQPFELILRGEIAHHCNCKQQTCESPVLRNNQPLKLRPVSKVNSHVHLFGCKSNEQNNVKH
jgi:hypothetical protein